MSLYFIALENTIDTYSMYQTLLGDSIANMQWVAWAIWKKRRIDPSSLFNISIYVLIESIIINCGFFLSLPFLRFHIKVKDTFLGQEIRCEITNHITSVMVYLSIEDGNNDIFLKEIIILIHNFSEPYF
ncbi:hypothetical protein ACJX0J_041849, partial [Zea mays]